MRQLTVSEVAELAGVKPSTIRAHQHRHTMPEPSGYVGVTPYWTEARISKWLETRREPGRPMKPRRRGQ